MDSAGLTGKAIRINAAGIRLAGNEFIEHQAMRCQLAGCLTKFGFDQVRILIAEAKNGGGLDTDEGLVFANHAGECTDVVIGKSLGTADQPLGE